MIGGWTIPAPCIRELCQFHELTHNKQFRNMFSSWFWTAESIFFRNKLVSWSLKTDWSTGLRTPLWGLRPNNVFEILAYQASSLLSASFHGYSRKTPTARNMQKTETRALVRFQWLLGDTLSIVCTFRIPPSPTIQRQSRLKSQNKGRARNQSETKEAEVDWGFVSREMPRLAPIGLHDFWSQC